MGIDTSGLSSTEAMQAMIEAKMLARGDTEGARNLSDKWRASRRDELDASEWSLYSPTIADPRLNRSDTT